MKQALGHTLRHPPTQIATMRGELPYRPDTEHTHPCAFRRIVITKKTNVMATHRERCSDMWSSGLPWQFAAEQYSA